MKISKTKIANINSLDIYSIEFTNNNNYSITFYNLGGYIHKILIPYKENSSLVEDVILGYKNVEGCKVSNSYFNQIIGRVSNRISNAKFSLNNSKFDLFKNINPHHLHGGKEGFNRKSWSIKKIEKNNQCLECRMSYLSTDLEENYPGNLACNVIYKLNNSNEFTIYFEAISDQDTIVNMTNHNYWNFHGHLNNYQNIKNHTVCIEADYICETDKDSIPTGNLISVKNTKFDLNNFFKISQNFLNEGGIDHNYVLKNPNAQNVNGKIFSNLTGMGVEYYTDQPGMQFYSGNMMDENYEGKYSKTYGKNFGMCFEPQLFPDAINQPSFPSPILKKGEKYTSTIKMKLRNDFI